MTWGCRHCEHWQRAGNGNGCAQGHEPFFVASFSDCRDFVREPGADDELEWPGEAASGPRSDLVMRGAVHA